MPELPHNFGSFDYKVTNEKIRQVLKARTVLDNTLQVAMPFVKATTTIQHEDYLGNGNIGFTLGLHAIQEDVRAEDMLSNVGGTAPYIGYTYTAAGTNQKIYANLPEDNILSKLFEQNNFLATSVEGRDFLRIPPPGITKMTIGRNKNGLLAAGDLQISVPSLAQLEILHRTFFIPGAGMILEWGQQFANEEAPSFGETGLQGNFSEYMFPWYDRPRLLSMLDRIAKREVGLEEVLNCYVYPTQGQYMWMFGRIANFSTKANSDGSFDCSVKVVGPSEDAWAYSTKQTVLPPKDDSGKICADGTNSIESYFTKTTTGLNLKSLLDNVYQGGLLQEWKGHVQFFENGNKKEGDPAADTQQPNVSQKSFAESEDAYFMTWRFFVNVVLNDPSVGVRAIFEKAGLSDSAKEKIAFLRPYLHAPLRKVDAATPGLATAALNASTIYIDDPLESYVGYNQYLRSIDPGTMIIVNEAAALLAKSDPSAQRAEASVRALLEESDKSKQFLALGSLEQSANGTGETSPPDSRDRAFLSAGVWLNHKAVAECMAGSDTVLRGVVNILDRMNNATRGFWQLTLDAGEPQSYVCPTAGVTATYGTTKTEYSVIDGNYKPNSVQATERLLKKIHIFNKYIRKDGTKLIGSEVTDCTVDLALPKRLFSQIATMGLVQPQDLQAAGGEVSTDSTNPCKNALVSDANDSLREMFSITTLSAKSSGGQGPDLTIKPIVPSPTGVCGQNNSQTTAQTAGTGNQVAAPNASSAGQPPENDENQKIKQEAQATLDSDVCKKCQQQCPPPAPAPGTAAAAAAAAPPGSQTVVPYDSVQGVFNVPIDYTNKPAKLQGAVQLFNAGFRNGRLPEGSMIRITQYAACTAAKTFKESGDALIRMITAARAAGHKLQYCEGYRPIGTQINCVKDKGWTGGPAHIKFPTALPNRRTGGYIGMCAKPGTSNHGWGLAFDLSTSDGGQIKANSPVHNWLKANAATYGFIQDPVESWHWEYTQPITFTGSAPVAPTPTPAVGITPPPTPPPSDACKDCAPCDRARSQLQQVETKIQSAEAAESVKSGIMREFPGLEDIFRYVEVFPELMLANIRCDSNGDKSNAFGASPGTLSLTADLKMPGINGMRIGELFWVDRIPAFYKVFGAFQVMSIEDTIDINGWQTGIHAQFNYLGTKWKEAIMSLLDRETVWD